MPFDGTGPYSIGHSNWNGLSKLIEEAGEVIQVAGKIIGASGDNEHWDGSNLVDRLEEELGDLLASIYYVIDHNIDVHYGKIINRCWKKNDLFCEWNESNVNRT